MLKRRIKRITIKNYRSITDLTVEMPDLMVLVGENGSGKSNFVDALRFLSNAMNGGLNRAIGRSGGMQSIRHQPSGSNDNSQMWYSHIEVSLEIDNEIYIYGFQIGMKYLIDLVQREYFRKGDVTLFDYNRGNWEILPHHLPLGKLSDNLALPLLTNYPEFAMVYNFLSEINIFTIHPQLLSQNDVQKLQSAKLLNEYGDNLFSLLYEIEQDFPQLKDKIVEYLSYIVDISAINVREVAPGSLLMTIKHKNENLFGLTQESDGTRRILAMLTALHQPYTPSLLAIEEPELFIHPSALAMLCEIIEEASLRQQIIITTHSPDLIAKFDVNAIRVVELTDDGTKIDVIVDSQLEAINEKLFGTGDILRIDGHLKRKEHEA